MSFSPCVLKYKMGGNNFLLRAVLLRTEILCKMSTHLAHSRSLINADCGSLCLRNNDSIMVLSPFTNIFAISLESQESFRLLEPVH